MPYKCQSWPISSGRARSARPSCGLTGTASFMCWIARRASFLLGKPFVEVTWASGFDQKGRPVRVSGQTSSLEGTRIYPGNPGGTSWYSPSYSPRTGLFYVSAWANSSSIFVKVPVEYKEGREYAAERPRPRSPLTGHLLLIFGNRRKATARSGRSTRKLVKENGNSKWPTSPNRAS